MVEDSNQSPTKRCVDDVANSNTGQQIVHEAKRPKVTGAGKNFNNAVARSLSMEALGITEEDINVLLETTFRVTSENDMCCALSNMLNTKSTRKDGKYVQQETDGTKANFWRWQNEIRKSSLAVRLDKQVAGKPVRQMYWQSGNTTLFHVTLLETKHFIVQVANWLDEVQDLFSKLINPKEDSVLNTASGRRMAAEQILDILRVLLKKGVLHCDLKPDNILFVWDTFDRFHLMPCDYGLGRMKGESANASAGHLCGSLAYICQQMLPIGRPLTFREMEIYGANKWAIVVMLYLLATFPESTFLPRLPLADEGEQSFFASLDEKLPEWAVNIIRAANEESKVLEGGEIDGTILTEAFEKAFKEVNSVAIAEF